jgi:hypothetical protein
MKIKELKTRKLHAPLWKEKFMTLKGVIFMRNSISALIKTLILLICSVIQMVEIIIRGLSEILGRIGDLLKNISGRLLKSLERGTYESTTEATIEVD